MKRLITLLLLQGALFATTALAVPAIEIIDSYDIELSDITISVEQNTLRVTNANGMTVQVYKITGVEVMSAKIDSDDKRIELDLPKGCYIVKVGKIARKIFIG